MNKQTLAIVLGTAALAGLLTGCVTRGQMERIGKKIASENTVTASDLNVLIPADCPFVDNIDSLRNPTYKNKRSVTDGIDSTLSLSLYNSMKAVGYFANATERPRYKLEAEIVSVNETIIKSGNIGHTPDMKRNFDTIVCQPKITFTLTENVKETTEGVVVFQNTYTGQGEGQRGDAERLAMRDAVRQFLNEITESVSK